MEIKLNQIKLTSYTPTLNSCYLISPRLMQSSLQTEPEYPAALATLQHCRLMCEAGQFWLLREP